MESGFSDLQNIEFRVRVNPSTFRQDTSCCLPFYQLIFGSAANRGYKNFLILSESPPLTALIKIALAYDWLAAQMGKLAAWAVLFAALISSGNAFVRYGFDIS